VGAVVLASDGTEALALDPDGVYLSASVIKLPLVMTLYVDAAAGRWSLEEKVAVGERVLGSGVLRDLRDVDQMSLRDLAALTMGVSDNTATNRLIELVGVDRVNEMLDAWGCRSTRLRRGMFDADAKGRGLDNHMTPRETASLLLRVVREAPASEAMAGVLALLERNTNTLRLGRYLPRGATLAHKDGWLDDPVHVDNDAGVIRAGSTVIAAGFTYELPPVVARPLLGLLGLAAAELAGAQVTGLPLEMVGSA
jgi:beta-lactamase class A